MNFLSSKSNVSIFIYLTLIALVVRLGFLLFFKFDGLYGQDAFAHYDWTKQFMLYISEFKIPPKVYWPCGYFIFSSLFSFISLGSVHFGTLTLSIMSGSFLAGIIYLLTYELLKNIFEKDKARNLSVICGLFFCFSGMAIKSSIVIMSDAPALILLSCAILFLVKYYNYAQRRFLIYSFIFLSLAVMTRYANALIAPLFIIIFANCYFKSTDKKKSAIDFLLSVVLAFIIFIPELYYISNHGISYFQSGYPLPPGTTWAAAWNPAHFFMREFNRIEGNFYYKLPSGLFYAEPVFHPLYLSLFGLTFIWGAINAIGKKYFIIILFCFIWIALFYLYLAGLPFQSLRYTMSFLPPLAVISVIGIGCLNIKKIYKNIFVLSGFILLFGYAVFHIGNFSAQKNKDLEIVRWVDNTVPQNSLLLSFGISMTINHYSSIKPDELYLNSPQFLKSKIDSSSGSVYIILPVKDIRMQWKDTHLERNVDFLMKEYNPAKIDSMDVYSFYKISK